MTYEFNLEVAEQEFYRRYEEYQGKQINNASLHAGASMYYYCNGCGKLVSVKPEGWWRSPPPRYCNSCKILSDHGVLDRLEAEARERCQVQLND